MEMSPQPVLARISGERFLGTVPIASWSPIGPTSVAIRLKTTPRIFQSAIQREFPVATRPLPESLAAR